MVLRLNERRRLDDGGRAWGVGQRATNSCCRRGAGRSRAQRGATGREGMVECSCPQAAEINKRMTAWRPCRPCSGQMDGIWEIPYLDPCLRRPPRPCALLLFLFLFFFFFSCPSSLSSAASSCAAQLLSPRPPRPPIVLC
ncbi:hypothetical protein BS50DRAFT_154558 [Corynespora cassiicola Philippines]|uniref:Uncharacterized protein n=1 Tax=Corynespora cassiicola Philippines TaxID=1448308 RepID=A0A2T2N6T0_CORCC|nr:hypothetical protein BS50DRAFT_154558 [Corynespora cassiicola Philippines]